MNRNKIIIFSLFIGVILTYLTFKFVVLEEGCSGGWLLGGCALYWKRGLPIPINSTDSFLGDFIFSYVYWLKIFINLLFWSAISFGILKLILILKQKHA